MGHTGKAEEPDVSLRFERVYRNPELARQAILYYMALVEQKERENMELRLQYRQAQQTLVLLRQELSDGRWVKVVG